ncbi:WG repeat-containing protein [Chitinophaga sp. NPDC101104]|uniref:WG repeat-containing protein n=1 Tax=Chitinophaga sp. NPDC101104 TaxID=3390561 RepID=UPI003D03BAF4
MKKVLLLLFAALCGNVSETAAQRSTEVLVPYRKGNKWGYCKLDKTIVIAPQFDDAQPFGELDEEELDDADIARVKKGAEEFWIDRKGKRKKPEEVDETRAGEGLMMSELVSGEMEDPHPKVRMQDGKAGLMQGDNVLLGFQFDSIRTGISTANDYVIAKSGGKWGVVFTEAARRGKWLIPAQFDEVNDLMEGRYLFAVSKNGQQGVWGINGAVLPVAYDKVALAGSNWHYCAIAALDEAGIRLFGLNGKKLNDEVYDWTYTEVGNGVAGDNKLGFYKLIYVYKNGKYGLVDNTGKALTGCKYDEIQQFSGKPFTLVGYKGKKGYIGVKGTEYFED